MPSSTALALAVLGFWASSSTAQIAQSSNTLKLAKKYTATEFLGNDWEWFTDADPTNGYVNYVSKTDAQSLGLTDTMSDGSFLMRVDADDHASGRGRNSVRISSKAKFADGVYILDLNHMPVGCGTWPAWWTVVKDGWPKGGEIDIIEGANAVPSLYSTTYNASVAAGYTNGTNGYPINYDVSSLHTSASCSPVSGSYMSGNAGANACSAKENNNIGCGVNLPDESVYTTASFGSGVNEAGGGWFALWRDFEHSKGAYVYFWPRNATDVPDDVRYANTTTTNVANWGKPGANITVPTCASEFANHVIVFNIAFCGDYAGATYTASGCPSTCQSFVQNYPKAFGETYWSINSLRVYNTSGKPASGGGLSKGAIAGIAVGAAIAVALLIFGFFYLRRRRNAARLATKTKIDSPNHPGAKGFSWTGFDDIPSSSRESLPGALATGSDYDTTPFRKGKKYASSISSSRRREPSGDADTDDAISLSSSTHKKKKKKDRTPRLATAKPRTGKTVLKPGMTKHHFLEGETATPGYHSNYTNTYAANEEVPLQARNSSWAGFAGSDGASPSRKASWVVGSDTPPRKGSFIPTATETPPRKASWIPVSDTTPKSSVSGSRKGSHVS